MNINIFLLEKKQQINYIQEQNVFTPKNSVGAYSPKKIQEIQERKVNCGSPHTVCLHSSLGSSHILPGNFRLATLYATPPPNLTFRDKFKPTLRWLLCNRQALHLVLRDRWSKISTLYMPISLLIRQHVRSCLT